jgi:stage V sporulation protein S
MILNEVVPSLNTNLIKVAATSRATAVAGAIAGMMRQNSTAHVQAIGAAAINQSIKAIAIAHRYLLLDGINTIFVPYFVNVQIRDEEKTAMCFHIQVNPNRPMS